jgi:hypothetical protein
MAVDIIMPRLSDSMPEGVIDAWLKGDGDYVERGDEILEIETDKAAMRTPPIPTASSPSSRATAQHCRSGRSSSPELLSEPGEPSADRSTPDSNAEPSSSARRDSGPTIPSDLGPESVSAGLPRVDASPPGGNHRQEHRRPPFRTALERLGRPPSRALSGCVRQSASSSGGGIRTRDLRVMSPTSYLTAPPRGVVNNSSNGSGAVNR